MRKYGHIEACETESLQQLRVILTLYLKKFVQNPSDFCNKELRKIWLILLEILFEAVDLPIL